MKETKEKEIPKNNWKLTIILIIISILLVVGSIGFGFFLGKNSDKEESKSSLKENEELENKEDNKNNNLSAIDKEESFKITVVEVEKYELKISTNKPNYDIAEEDLQYYKDGYIGYYSDEILSYNNINSGIMFVDSPKYKFVPLYKCKNAEFGKCGYAETLGVSGEYNLEEGLKLGQEGLIYLDNRYVFVYDSEYYLEEPYTSYFSKEVPLIIYDTKTNKEIGKYSSIVYNYGDTSSSLIAVDLDGNYGVISIVDGKINNIVDFKYSYIGRLYNQTGLMLVDNSGYYVYYPHNESKVGPFNNQIASYSDKFIITNEGRYLDDSEDNYRLYDVTGKKVLVDAGYKYMEIVDQSAKEYIIVADENGNINVVDQDGKEILNEWVTDVYGFYHIRCCDAIMAYRYNMYGSIMELYITKEGKNILEGEIETYKYTIDLSNKTYEVELYEDYY